MAAATHDVERRLRDSSRHIYGNLQRIERVMVALKEERARGDLRQVLRGEVQIVVAVGEGPGLREDRIDLRLPTRMPSPHFLPLFLRQQIE